MYKISIVVPVYNAEKYICECLDSLLAQTLDDIEIVCVDDGSIDNSANILNEYLNNYANIKVIFQKNQGPGIARKNGCMIAESEYIGSIDADDFVDKNYFKLIYNKSQEYKDADMIYIARSTHNQFIPKCFHTALEKSFLVQQSAFHGRIYKKKFLEQYCLFWDKPNFYEDMYSNITTLIHADYIPTVDCMGMYYYRKVSNSLSKTRNESSFDYLNTFKESIKYIKKSSISLEDKKIYIKAIEKEWKVVNTILYKGLDIKCKFKYLHLISCEKPILICYLLKDAVKDYGFSIKKKKINGKKYKVITILGIKIKKHI